MVAPQWRPDLSNQSVTRSVAFVGPLPPPVNGFSNVCAMMLDVLETKMRVAVFDRAPILNNRLLTILRQVTRPLSYFAGCITERDGILYLALSGGRGQFIDLGYVLISKVFGRQVFVHHHSFLYINAPSRFNKWLFSMIRNDTHIVLSKKMGEQLANSYGLDRQGIRVVSNAAFYDALPVAGPTGRSEAEPLQIGFLSNITFEKGFVEFFGILKQLKSHRIVYRAFIAGPLAPAAEETFHKLCSEVTDVEYLGPVYGEAKERFYQRLDIFLFPTKYANEAEPLVVYEALRRGVFVIACDRGAISEMLRNGAGLAVAMGTIVESAVKQIAEFNKNRPALISAQGMSMQQAHRIRSSGRVELEKLLTRMQGAGCNSRMAT
jgi:glycosyltransferase involved in cell wall biosynthesis